MKQFTALFHASTMYFADGIHLAGWMNEAEKTSLDDPLSLFRAKQASFQKEFARWALTHAAAPCVMSCPQCQAGWIPLVFLYRSRAVETLEELGFLFRFVVIRFLYGLAQRSHLR